MYARLMIVMVLITMVSGVYYKYSQMEKEILSSRAQAVEYRHGIADRDEAIQVMALNVVEVDKAHRSELAAAKFGAASKSKKEVLEAGLSYDKSSSVELGTKRFYLK